LLFEKIKAMERENTTNPPRKIVRRTTEEIRSLMVEYKNSGLSAKAFCSLHKIKRAYFSRWLKRYENKKQPKGFVPVQGAKEPSLPKAVLFAEYRGIRFYQAVEPSYLKSLVS